MKKALLALCFPLAFSLTPTVFADEGFPEGYEILGFYGTLEPKPIFNPTKVDFGTVKVGKEKSANIKILNRGYGYLIFKKIYLANGTAFTIKNITCSGLLSYGQSCQLTISFKPPKNGTFKDWIIVITNTNKHPIYKIFLTGKAIGKAISCPQAVKVCPLKQQNEFSLNQTKAVNPIQNKTEIVFTSPPKVASPVVEPINKTAEGQNIVAEKKKTSQVEKKSSNLTGINGKTKNTPLEKKGPIYKTYVVKPCDTLWDLSYKFYKTPLLWAAIYEANKDKIKDPWIIKAGTVLRIPINLTPEEIKKYKKETIRLMEEMADRPLGPKCPIK